MIHQNCSILQHHTLIAPTFRQPGVEDALHVLRLHTSHVTGVFPSAATATDEDVTRMQIVSSSMQIQVWRHYLFLSYVTSIKRYLIFKSTPTGLRCQSWATQNRRCSIWWAIIYFRPDDGSNARTLSLSLLNPTVTHGYWTVVHLLIWVEINITSPRFSQDLTPPMY